MILFAGFDDPKAPVICFAGAETRSIVRVPRRLFALLRGARASLPLRNVVRVVSCSTGSAGIFVLDEEQAMVERFANVARAMAEDLLGEDPLLPQESWVAHRPFWGWASEKATPAPKAYLENRIGPGPAVLPDVPAHRLARALWSIDRRERAIQVLEVACASSSEVFDHFHLGELLAVELERPRDGIPHLRRACELAPEMSQPFTSLGIALSMVRDWSGAVNAFESACKLAPRDAGAWANLAQGYSNLGDEAGMKRAASRAQELEPGEPLSSALLAGKKPAPPG